MKTEERWLVTHDLWMVDPMVDPLAPLRLRWGWVWRMRWGVKGGRDRV